MDFSDGWRVLNAVLALIAAVMIAKNLISKWRVRKPRMRLMSMSLLALLLVVVEAAFENIHFHTPLGLQSGLTTMACVWVVIAVVFTPDDYTEIEREREEESSQAR